MFSSKASLQTEPQILTNWRIKKQFWTGEIIDTSLDFNDLFFSLIGMTDKSSWLVEFNLVLYSLAVF